METQNDFQPKPVSASPSQEGSTPEVASNTTEVAEPVAKTSWLAGFKGFYANNKIYFWAIFAGVVIIGLLAFFAFRKTPAPPVKEANVNIEFTDSPQTATIGGQMVYHITITNQDRQTLTHVQLELIYPDGFSYVSSGNIKPSNLSGSTFPLTDLPPGVPVAISVKTKASGNINDSKTLTARLHYQYANFNSEFVKEAAYAVRMTASDVAFDLNGPTSTNNAQLVTYTLHYKNNSNAEIKNARIQMDYPSGFYFASAQPSPDVANNIWNFSSIAVGGEGDIQIVGNFRSANPGENENMNANFLVLGNNGQYLTQVTSSFITSIQSLPLLVTQELQQSGENTDTVNPGDTLNFAIRYQNNNTTVAQGVNVVVTLETTALDLSSIVAQGAQINNNTISWNAAGVPNLASVAPNESGQLQFVVRVKSPATKDSSKNLMVISHIKISAAGFEAPFPGNDVSLKISSPSQINTALAYVSGDLPPKVGRTTTYKVTISLQNSTNDFSDTVVTMSVPAGFAAGSINSAEQNSTNFDPSTGQLTWNVGVLPAHSGQFRTARTLTFNVTISPSSAQIYNSVVLVNSINMQAKDLFTGAGVNVSADNIATDDLPGLDGAAKGQVQP